MPYIKTNWKDLPDVTTPINAARLNKLETQYEEAVTDATAAAASYTDTALIGALSTPQAIAAAERARDEADRAEDARDQAEVFSATTVELQDAAVAALVATPGSDTQTQLNATFVGKQALPVSILDYATTSPSDQTANIQAAINAVPVGGALDIPAGMQFRVDGQLNITKAITVLSTGRGGFYSTATGAQKLINVASSDVKLRGIKVAGPQYANAVTQRGINIAGTSSNRLTGVEVTDCEIVSWANHGIWVEQVEGLTVDRNIVRDMGYAGIGLMSVVGFAVRGNHVTNVIQAPGYANSYGIHMSRAADTDDFNAHPRTANGVVDGNIVANIPNWAGIDTHGGQNITIANNNVTNCKMPISAVSTKNAADAYVYGPLEINIIGNTVDSTVTDGTYNSLHIVGNATERGTGAIRGNIVRGHGFENSGISGSIGIEYTRGVVIEGNVLVEPSPMGIIIVTANDGFVCTGNTIIDPWSNTVLPKAIMLNGANNSGQMSRNILLTAGRVADYTAANGLGIGVSNHAGNAVQIGDNSMELAGTPLYDPGAKTKSTLGAKPSVSGSRSGNAALKSLVAALADKGLITDSTSA